MRVAVLGASCFALNLSYWLAKDNEVLLISRSPLRPKPFTYGLEDLPNFHYKQAHLGFDLDLTLRALDKFQPECIVNFAALCEVGLSWKHALDYYETNLMSLVRLTNELEKRPWFKKFVQIGSSEVYGSVVNPAREDTAVNPSSPYAASKAVFDFHLRAISKQLGFPGVIVMPSNGYCEGQTLNRIIPKAIIAAKTGQKLALQGGGVARKSYLHADDISSAIQIVMENGVLGETYNCGPLWPVSIKDLVEMVAKRFGKTLVDIADIAPERTGQDSQYWLDSTKIKSLGWKPSVSLDKGIDRVIAWFDKYPELLTMETTYEHRP